MDPEGYASLGLAMANQQAVTERLAEIRVPTGVIVGSGDTAFLPGSRALAAGIAGARLEVIPDSGHHPHQENPEAWDAALRRVLPRRVTKGDDPR
jgi:3-oxoadipate enol-lactonase/4-carboxymuconolactone decarboxylase